MSTLTIQLPNGHQWTPRFVQTINEEKCIGCGRCYRVCGRDVFKLVGVDEEGEYVELAAGEDEDDDDGEYEKKIMTIANQTNCIGCEACSRICPKKCHTHGELEV